jgi:dTDP-4-dehydrorhamnose reductase|tara:strand:- start:1330 stop:2211 length:882 start_codon:yes stop_codon:yes gene_type:complete
MILIIGGSGFLGYYLHHNFIKNKQITHSTYFKHKINEENFHYLDIADEKETYQLIKELKPNVIIYASAITDVDLCESNHVLANTINFQGLKNIIDSIGDDLNIKIIYISTSAVFDGSKKSYLETDKTNPISYYGLTKSMGENLLINSTLPYLIIRTDQPYYWKKNWHHTNSVLRVIEKLKRGEKHNEIFNWYNSPTFVPDFINCLEQLLIQNCTGIFHVVGSDFKSRFDFAQNIVDIFELDNKQIIPINSSELKLLAKRANVKLDNNKVIEKIGIKMSNIEHGLKKMKEKELI